MTPTVGGSWKKRKTVRLTTATMRAAPSATPRFSLQWMEVMGGKGWGSWPGRGRRYFHPGDAARVPGDADPEVPGRPDLTRA